MKRTFWFGLGIAAGFGLSRKASASARQATPAGLASNMGDAVGELAGAIGTFGAEVRAGMQEREEELHDIVQERSARPVVPRTEKQRRAASPRGSAVESRTRRARSPEG